MSYILDALKKSEEERHQGEVPNLGMNTTLIHNKHNTRSVWPWIVGGLLALNLLIVIYWLSSRQDNHMSSDVAFPAYVEDVDNAEPASRHTDNAPTESAPSKRLMDESQVATGSATTKSTQVSASVEPVEDKYTAGDEAGTTRMSISDETEGKVSSYELPTEKEPQIIRPKSGGRTYKPKELNKEKATSLNESPPQYSDIIRPSANSVSRTDGDVEPVDDSTGSNRLAVPHISDKSVEFQRQIPDMTFNSHIFTKSSESRRVMINNIYLREGQSFSGMTVEEVTEDGVVLSLNGESFKMGVLRNWSSK